MAERSVTVERGRVANARRVVATFALRTTSLLSRVVRVGSGSTIGGRVGLLIDPDLLAELGARRDVLLITGTNGKTTTTRLLVEALGGPTNVASSGPGANLPPGLVSALASATPGGPAVLEVDERYLGIVDDALGAKVIVLLNLSRDQLDRMSEVRMIAERWRTVLEGSNATVIANADDPLVVHAARAAPHAVWVGVGGRWHEDSYHCPLCSSRVEFDADDGASPPWHCSCGFVRPPLDAVVVGDELRISDGSEFRIDLDLPGQFNRANAAMAALAARTVGVPIGDALSAARSVREVAGRFAVVSHEGVDARLLLAKNPAGWAELIGLLEEGTAPIVVGINARLADGHDPSWLWDVPFERIAGRFVVATGERRLDLAVRLRHAGVDHIVEADQVLALARAGATFVDYVGNYTAFQMLRRRLRSAPLAHRRIADEPAPSSHAPRPHLRRRTGAQLSVVVVHPDLLGTYGDVGNGRVLADRAEWRDIPVELVFARSDEPLPATGDIYCLGGGEDGPQTRSADRLADGTLSAAVDGGAVVLAVCAGFQIIGRSFPGPSGPHEGVGLLDVVTEQTAERRAVGEVVAEPIVDADWPIALGTLSGFENHQARTRLAAQVRPLAIVAAGVGNGFGGIDGAVSGRVLATYLHGPVLARNPGLADLLLSLATASSLAPLDDAEEMALRADRLKRTRR